MDFLVNGFIKAIQLLITCEPVTMSAVTTTLKVTGLSMAASLVTGLPAGFALGYFSFPGKRVVRLITDTMLSLPTVFIGLVVFAVLSSRGPLGGHQWLFTLTAIVIGQAILAFPIVTALTATAVESAEEPLTQTLLSLGSNSFQLIITTLWEVRYAVVAAALTAYGRVMTEVGISMMVGGNIKWHTRTITTAIALETGKGMFAQGIALGLILVAIAFVVNISVSFLKKH